jgi:hypothetical protein
MCLFRKVYIGGKCVVIIHWYPETGEMSKSV